LSISGRKKPEKKCDQIRVVGGKNIQAFQGKETWQTEKKYFVCTVEKKSWEAIGSE
jgi:hypothetical protein